MTTDLHPKSARALADQVAERLARTRLADYCRRMDPNYIEAAHTRLICEHLEALERRDIRFLMVFEPPRHSKTYHVSERFPAWWLGRNPRDSVILASYAAELAERNSRIVRALTADPHSPFDVEVDPLSHAANRWNTTAGGAVLAVGIGGGMTGHGADQLNIDDPVKDREDADSANQREKGWSWYQDVARTRLHPRAVILLTQTRWHEDDLSGRILNSPGASDWTVLRLPAVAEEGDPLGRAIGEPLWPERYGLADLPSVEKGEISSRSWNAMYQQRPQAEEGGAFRREWMQRRWSTLPPQACDATLGCSGRGQCDHLNPPPADLAGHWTTIVTADTAFKEGVGSDWSVLATWGTDGKDFYLIDVWRGHVAYPDLRAKAIEIGARIRASAILIEDAASGQSLIQELRRTTNLPIIAVKPQGSKVLRAEAVSPLFEAGRVVLPQRAPWLDAWISEHLAFPTGAHDDQVDTTSLALMRLGVMRDWFGGDFVRTLPGGRRRTEAV